MIGSSGDAETNAVIAAAERFTEATGTPVEVIPAQDLVQQLTQGFAGGNPPDVFYVGPEQVRTFQGSLYPYGSEIDDVDDFYPALIESYTIDDELYCLPKDFSNLALVINADAWEAAGLTDADIPTTWEELTAVSETLTSGDQTGLVMSGEADRVGAFMVQAGGWYLDDEGTEAIADSEENAAALAYVQENLLAGNFQFAAQVEAGWGGEALGTAKSAMTIEGPWIVGALDADFPDINWIAAELPEGPAGKGTLTFSNCWGVAAEGDTAGAVELVKHLTSPEEQQAFTEAFGVNPSRASLEEWNAEAQPEKAAFNAGVEYAKGQVAVPGFPSVATDFNAQLEALGSGSATPEDVLERLQKTLEDLLAEQD
ncbi:MAG: extracellular solute-binding protein [Acidimicrobiia bacterium]|nr:extracellular solute-binding protein [Acidimicrobiia bacterium]